MSRGINKVILIGNVGQEPEVRYLPNGTAVANLSVATSETWKDKETGAQQERTEWHRVSAFGRLAEIIGEYVKTGSKIYIEGKLRTRQWEREGQKHYTTEILADQMQMLDSRGGDQSHNDTSNRNRHSTIGGQEPAAAPRSQSGGPASEPEPDFDDDIPF